MNSNNFYNAIAPRFLVSSIAFVTIYSLPFFQPPHPLFTTAISLADRVDTRVISSSEININLIKLGQPPFRQDAPKNIISQPSPIQLVLLSATPNQITDDRAWFERHDLSLPTYQVPNHFRQIAGDIPSYIPTMFRDNILVKAIRDRHKEFLIYGRNFGENKYLLIYDLKQQQIIKGYDFSNYIISPSYEKSARNYINQTFNWVIQEDNILYFSHSHNTYAKSSHGMNAYLTALDLNTNQIVWRSQPLVCNAGNFIIINSVIICGYGFTAEPDYLYLIDKNDGEVLQQIRLKTAPNTIIQQNDKLHVRTYDTDYIFEIKRIKTTYK